LHGPNLFHLRWILNSVFILRNPDSYEISLLTRDSSIFHLDFLLVSILDIAISSASRMGTRTLELAKKFNGVNKQDEGFVEIEPRGVLILCLENKGRLAECKKFW
jgi:hypothetical protein